MLTRERIQAGWVQEMVARHGNAAHVLTADELCISRGRCLAGLAPGEDVWVFGYGSLIWNPCFDHVERRIAKVVGWHRRFCLWTSTGRGTLDRPGLMLGLERGGSCRGIAFRLAADFVETELDIVWRREMVTAAYCPALVSLATPEGRVRAVAFTINRRHDRYAGALPDKAVVEALATAEGPLGSNRDYLVQTAEHLDELGLRDRGLERLRRAVEAYRGGPAVPQPHEAGLRA